MRTTTIGDVKILLPDLDPEDLDNVHEPASYLTEASIEGLSWRGGQLEDASIRSSRIAGADFSESTWESGTIWGSEITRTDLSGSTLSGVTMERCAFTGSRFTGTRLIDVRLKDVLFEGCRFDYATFQRIAAAGAVAFTDCTLANSMWSSCRLSKIAMRSCQLTNLELDSCQLEGADLRGNRLHNLKGALVNLQGVTLGQDQLSELTQLVLEELRVDVRAD